MDAARFEAKSPLIAPELESQLRQLLNNVNTPVEFTCLLGDDPKSLEMGTFLTHICTLSPQLTCRFLSLGEDSALDQALDGTLLPATGVGRPSDTPRLVFHGVPGGKEITSFASAILTAGEAAKPLDKYTLKDIAKIKRTMNLQVCVSLGCAHCAQLVIHAHRIAWENPLVTAHMIDANLYSELVKEYAIQRVPLTVLDGKTSFPGGKTMAELTTLLAKA